MKTCTKCGEVKPIEDFHRLGRGRRSQCRECRSSSTGLYTPRVKGTFIPNRYRVENGRGVIELTNNFYQTIAEALVSLEDLPRVIARGHWCRHKSGHGTYCARWVKEGEKRKKREWLHRFIVNAPSDLEVDHIDHDGLNDCRENLRLATRSQNVQNVRRDETKSRSGVRNVCWDKARSSWFVSVMCGGKAKYFGHFATVEEAAPVAESARRALHSHSPENSTNAQKPESDAEKGVATT